MIASEGCVWLDCACDDLRDFQAVALQASSRGIDRIGPPEWLHDTVAQFLIGPLEQGSGPEPRKQVLSRLHGQAFDPRHIGLDEGDVAPARFEHAADFGAGHIRFLEMLHYADRDDQVETLVRKRQLLGPGYRTFRRRALPGPHEGMNRWIDPVFAAARQSGEQPALSAADLEYAVAGRRLREFAKIPEEVL